MRDAAALSLPCHAAVPAGTVPMATPVPALRPCHCASSCLEAGTAKEALVGESGVRCTMHSRILGPAMLLEHPL